MDMQTAGELIEREYERIGLDKFTSPYGDWDYQQTPAGSSVMVAFDEPRANENFHALVERARAAGFPMYGSAVLRQHSDEDDQSGFTGGYIVLTLGAGEQETTRLSDWAREQPGVVMSRHDRGENDASYEPQ